MQRRLAGLLAFSARAPCRARACCEHPTGAALFVSRPEPRPESIQRACYRDDLSTPAPSKTPLYRRFRAALFISGAGWEAQSVIVHRREYIGSV